MWPTLLPANGDTSIHSDNIVISYDANADLLQRTVNIE